MQMNPVVKTMWLEALRDPNAKQIKNHLGDMEGGRCCLGVLSDLAAKNKVIEPPVRDDIDSFDLAYGPCRATSMPPYEVIDWAKLDDPYELAEMNDQGETFTEIADYIEEKL